MIVTWELPPRALEQLSLCFLTLAFLQNSNWSVFMTAIDIDFLKTWIGREQHVDDTLSPFPARALAAVLDHTRLPQVGELLPPSWHWLYFLETPSSSSTSTDGHPHKGSFLPPVPLPRRMWSAGWVEVAQPLRLGMPAEKHSVVRSVELKKGKTGALAFVILDHRLYQNGELCIHEEQTLVYRAMPSEGAPPPDGESAPLSCDWSRSIEPTTVLLLRFSALTYNAHRIHYDRDYATRAEFYPGLVVHGPLLTTLLLDLAIQNTPGLRLTRFHFRAVRPTFDLGPIELRGKREGNDIALWSIGYDQCVGMRVSAILGDMS